MNRGDLIEVRWYGRKCDYSCRFRIDPVPHTGGYSFSRYYRHPKTTQERREYINAVEVGVRVRGNRCPRLLPDSWDDIPIGRYNKRSWKRQKKRKQWM